jgi:hypothetical protein
MPIVRYCSFPRRTRTTSRSGARPSPRACTLVSDPEVDPVSARLRCRDCEDIIGAYEPMVVVTHHGPQETSLAADPALYETEHPCFHRACYVATHGEA